MTGPAFALPYGDLEKLFSVLVGAEPAAVRSRFRKLRLRQFPDDIRTGTGVRVQYNLRRVLALWAVFQLNNLYVPQGHAAAMVKAAWPELCRALIIAATDLRVLRDLENAPPSAGPVVEIGGGAVRAGDATLIDFACVREIDVTRLAIRPAIALDTSRLLQGLSAWAIERGAGLSTALTNELRLLERDFGWRRHTVHSADYSAPMADVSFLYDGPYLDRALALLEASSVTTDGVANLAAQVRLQSLYDYLFSPAPIDQFKGAIGVSKTSPRLADYLHFYAREVSLETYGSIPESMNLYEPRRQALELVKMALAAKPSEIS